MINYDYENLFYESNYRNLIIVCDNEIIDNDNIAFESMQLTESLIASEQLKFGEVISNEFKIRLLNNKQLINKKIDVFMVMNNDDNTSIDIGKYTVKSDILSSDKQYKDIVAYDKLYDVIHTDVVTWYQGLNFPISIKDMRDSLCNFLNIEQTTAILINDDFILKKNANVTSLSGSTILQAICELNGVFPKINRKGYLAYITLATNYDDAKELPMFYHGEGAYQDYIVAPITQICIKQTDNDVGTTVGQDGNCYYVTNNMLTYGLTSDDIQTIGNNMLRVIGGISYRPYSVNTMGNPCYEIGDAIKVIANDELTINTYILRRVLSGIQGLKDNFSASGNKIYADKSNSIISSITALKQTTNILYRDNEKTQSIISNMQIGSANLISDSEYLQSFKVVNTINN